jgi:hypothetical protein
MALRSYATNSFPALVGQSHTVLNAFQDMNPDFIIQYERFPEQKFTLIWPEFADPKKLMNQETWEKFAVLRAFLKYWAGEDNSAPLIDTAYLKWLDLPEVYRKPLPLPMGFVLDRSRAASLPAPFNAAKKLARKSGDARAAAGITRGRRPRRDSHRPSRG